MNKRLKLSLFIIFVAAVTISVGAVVEPSTWGQPRFVGLTRSEVHAILGKPYAEYFPTKTFDGYAHEFLFGQRYFTIHYRSSTEFPETSSADAKVFETEHGICAGEFSYCLALFKGT